jgi:Carboxypeptidase regulatory-like domain
MQKRLGLAVAAVLCLAVCAVPARGQVFTGRIDLTAKDNTGAVLPGVTVTVTGPQANNAVTDTYGQVHFLNLPPGTYAVTAHLTGFKDYRNTSVPVGTGSIVSLDVTMAIAALATSVTVQAETPVIEAKKETVSTDISLDQLQRIPSSRDPWVILQTIPGINVDRVNVGGAESGQQSVYVSKGAPTGDNTWNIDGIAITDMSALGSSPTYYDFDMFQEMQVTTGGADPQDPTPGAQLNFVLKSGTNNFMGSARSYFENHSLQANNVPAVTPGGTPEVSSYNRMKQYTDNGFEVGGPIIKDRLFGWGAYGDTHPQIQVFTFDPTSSSYLQTARDATILKNTSLKLNGDINSDTRVSFTFFRGNKLKYGRSASAERPGPTTWDQTGPTDFYKAELNRTFGDHLFLTARYAHVSGGFSLTPEGGQNTSAYLDDNGVWHNTYVNYSTNRPQNNVQVEGNYFTGSNEFKAGFGWRRASVASESSWPGGLYTEWTGYPNMEAVVVRPFVNAGHGVYWDGYAGDTISANRFTVMLGARWDRQTSSIDTANVPANNLSPVLPALTSSAVSNAIVWNSFTPRVGITYAVDKDRKTLIRASYSMFASQMNATQASTVASTIPTYSYAYYAAVDQNGNGVADPSEFTKFLGVCCFDPNNPLGGNPNTIGQYKTPLTHEVVVGADHELMANMALSASFTWRRYTDFNRLQYSGVTSADYAQAGILTGTIAPIGAYSAPFYTVNPSAVPANFAQVYAVRPDYYQRYLGFETSLTKRLSNRWMMRVGWSSGVDREYFTAADALGDPTPTVTSTLASTNTNGGIVLTPSAGSGKSNLYLATPKYQLVVTGAYEAGYGINVGVNYLLRQGYAEPFYQNHVTAAADVIAPAGKSVLLVANPDNYRLPAVNSLDARVSKVFTFPHYNVNIDLDAFNLLNLGTTLGRQYNLTNLTTFNNVLEIMNPRIIRLGVRLSFK